ncbi:hypothetical protein [Arthrobacter sp.]|uniref:hypothetical protein n=1 Tax=Arthrobacter sp. TaxID=1667 RepID=UPI00289A2756|nr:hypothetical protein [Arthrobacter sp.]
MKTDIRIGPETAADADAGRIRAFLAALDSGRRQLRSWRWTRLAAAGISAIAAAAVLVSLNGMITGAGAAWWNLVIAAPGLLLAGLVVGSYFAAPIGAEASLCDTRWVLLGLTGLVIATSTGEGSLAGYLFAGAAPALLSGVIQPIFALLAAALLGWALGMRLELERKALSPPADGDEYGVCTTCRPLFPARQGPMGSRPR